MESGLVLPPRTSWWPLPSSGSQLAPRSHSASIAHTALGLSGTGGCPESLGTEWQRGRARDWTVHTVRAGRWATGRKGPFLSQARAAAALWGGRCSPRLLIPSGPMSATIWNQLGLEEPLRINLVCAPLWQLKNVACKFFATPTLGRRGLSSLPCDWLVTI